MQNNEQAIQERDERADAGQARTGLKTWHWVLITAVLCFKLGMGFQKFLDNKAFDKYHDAVEQCDKLISFLQDKSESGELIIRAKPKNKPTTIV